MSSMLAKIDPKNRLAGCHPSLAAIVVKAAEYSAVPFKVGEGLRTRERQMKLVAEGASTTMNSRHLAHPKDGLARAVDLVAYPDLNNNKQVDDSDLSWIWKYYADIAAAMKKAAKELGIPLEWGGDWKTFKDGPHYQLPWKAYP